MFWIVVAILTAAVAIVLMYPLMRKTEAPQTRRDGEVAVYRDQLAELDRERAAGLIGENEADYARAEIGRRLLAAAEAEEVMAKEARPRRHNLAASLITILLPALGLCLYIWNGSPETPDMPLEARLESPGNDMNLLVARAERHLAQNPEDGGGWDVLAPIYFKTLRLGDAELAYRNALRILGPSPERLTGLGETLVAGNDGIVIEAARDAFAQAEQLKPGNPRARFIWRCRWSRPARRKKRARPLRRWRPMRRLAHPGCRWCVNILPGPAAKRRLQHPARPRRIWLRPMT